MPRRRGLRAQRRRFFVACEGESEVGYAAWVQRLVDEAGVPVYLDIRKCRGGDPLAIVETAVQEWQARGKRRGWYVGQAIFLDADQRGASPDRTVRADRLIRSYDFHAIWSRPALEALLLKHIDGCEHLQPATSALAIQQLRDRWPEYQKGMTASALRARFDQSDAARAAAVVPELHAFLVATKLLA